MKKNGLSKYIWIGSVLVLVAITLYVIAVTVPDGQAASWAGNAVAFVGALATGYGISEQRKANDAAERREALARNMEFAKEWYTDVICQMDALYLCTNPEMPCELTEHEGSAAIAYLCDNWHPYLYNSYYSLDDRLGKPNPEIVEHILRRLLGLYTYIKEKKLQEYLYLNNDVEERLAYFYGMEVQVGKILKVSDPEVEKTYGKEFGVPKDTRRSFARLLLLLKELPSFE